MPKAPRFTRGICPGAHPTLAGETERSFGGSPEGHPGHGGTGFQRLQRNEALKEANDILIFVVQLLFGSMAIHGLLEIIMK